MTVREVAHILTITPDPENDEDWSWEIECPYQPDNLEADRRTCNVWFQCGCPDDGAVGPCPASPLGEHCETPIGIGWLGKQCWARYCDIACDLAGDIRAEHGSGAYVITVIGGFEELEFDVLARVEAVAA